MGANCAKPSTVNPSHRELSQTSDYRIQQNFPKPPNSEYFFQISLSNVCIFSYQDQLFEVVFDFGQNSRALFSQSEMTNNGKSKLWQKEKTCNLKISQHQLLSLKLRINVYWRNQKKCEQFKLKFGQLCRGPIHHDHLLPEFRSRIIFDIYINELIDVNIYCSDFKFHPKHLKMKGIKVSSDLIFTDNTNQYCDMKPQNMQQNLELKHKLFSKQLKQSTLRIRLWDLDPKTPDIYSQIYIPYHKFINNCDSYFTQRKNDMNFIKRTYHMKEKLRREKQINYCMPQNLNQLNSPTFNIQLEFSLTWQATETYVQQLEGVICSQKGINTVSPYMLKGQGGNSVFTKPDYQLDYKQIKSLLQNLKELKQKKNTAAQQKNILQKIYKSLTKPQQFSLDYDEDNDISTLQYQFLLIDLLQEISNLIEQGQYLINENIWKIFNLVIRRAELSIRYLHAIDDLRDKKKIGIKFYKFLCFTLIMIVRSTGIGISFNQSKYSQKFIAYSFFRFPWIQNYLIRHICKSNDPTLNAERLAEIGVSNVVKSPSKNMVFDWEGNLYNFIRKQPDFMNTHQKLVETIESFPQWYDQLFNPNDEELYFGGLCQFFNEAQMTLCYQGKILWEYFPSYQKFIGRFQAQIRRNQPIGLTKYFQQFSLKLMRNQRLLNTFIKFLFEKTFLTKVYSVERCIEMIRLMFEMLISKNYKKLPTNFNCNIFFNGIVRILQTNHSILVIKTLNVLYVYYDILSSQCQNNIAEFIVSPIFFQLFLHWFHLSRKIFMCFLLKHITPKIHEIEKMKKKGENITIENIQIIEKYRQLMKIIYEKYKQQKRKVLKKTFCRIQRQYFQRMKQKLINKKRHRKCRFSEESPKISRNKQMRHTLTFYDVQKLSKTEFRQIRPRKWSCQSGPDADQIPRGCQNYVVASVQEFENINHEKADLDKIQKQIMKIFGCKKKVDERE